VQCAEALRVQAYFDAQLDATGAHELEQHLAHCAECRESLNDLKTLRSLLRQGVTVERAPSDLRRRILDVLDREPEISARATKRPVWRLPVFWGGALSGFAGAALAALACFLILPASGNALVRKLVEAHVSSLQSGHLVSVVSTDRHTVKPWLAGRADVSPAVADFAAEGYKLLGGRVEPLEGQRSAVTVYQHGAHTINVFSWASDERAIHESTTRNGYHLTFWKVGNLQYCAVSDTGWDELGSLVRLLRELALREDRPTE
jgi:mycothiol system anti-sigma-R factor